MNNKYEKKTQTIDEAVQEYLKRIMANPEELKVFQEFKKKRKLQLNG